VNNEQKFVRVRSAWLRLQFHSSTPETPPVGGETCGYYGLTASKTGGRVRLFPNAIPVSDRQGVTELSSGQVWGRKLQRKRVFQQTTEPSPRTDRFRA